MKRTKKIIIGVILLCMVTVLGFTVEFKEDLDGELQSLDLTLT